MIAAAIAQDLDPVNLTGLGIGAVVLALVFRTLWKQEGGWRAVLEAARMDAKEARTDASAARADAKEARADAAAARGDAALSRQAEARCQADLARLARRFDDMLERDHRRDERVAKLEGHHSGQTPVVDDSGSDASKRS